MELKLPRFAYMLVILAAAAVVLGGCNGGGSSGLLSRPSIQVRAGDSTELSLAREFETDRLRYQHRLQELRQFYLNESNMTNIRWSYREQNNLQDAMTFTWHGLSAEPLTDVAPPVNANETILVERMVEARTAWLDSMDALAVYYQQSGQPKKFQRINDVRQAFDPIHTYRYLEAAEFPPLTLRPRDSIPEANALYERAVDLFWGGKGVTHSALTTNLAKEAEALVLFRQLIDTYPTSDRIALAAYYTADIYKEFFDENIRAVEWYKRAYTWLPEINEPARFQAAAVYDLRLNDKVKAMELYGAAAREEQFNRSNVSFALQRMDEIRAEADAQRREQERLRRVD